MNCGGRIYKGEDISVSIPFALSGYTNLSVSYFTNGEVSVERTEEQLVIDGGYIIADFDNTDLDILPDGVLRYTITCKVDGEDYVDSNNTPYYLKTPKDYDAKTAEEIWEEGYESGATSCSGSCEGVYEEGFADGHASGVTDGYAQGYPAGEAAQKAKLVSTAVTANTIIEREDGFSRVEINVPSGSCEGVYEEGFTDGHASGVTDGYAQGYPAGEAAQKAKLATTAVTANGTYSREDGFSSIEVNVPTSGGSCNLQSKSVSLTANSETITADTGYDGLSQVEVDASGRYNAGQGDAYAEVDSRAQELTFTENGVWEKGFFDGYAKKVTVNVPSGGSCDLQVKSVSLSSITTTITHGSHERPLAPSGQTVYGGAIDTWKSLIDQYGRINIRSWDDAGHTDSTLQGFFEKANGVYRYYQYQGDVPYPFDEMTPEWEDTMWGDMFDVCRQGPNVFFYNNFTYGFFSVVEPSALIFATSEYDGLSAVTVDASEIYTSGETAQKAKLVSTAITKSESYTRADGWSAVSVNVPVNSYAWMSSSAPYVRAPFSTSWQQTGLTDYFTFEFVCKGGYGGNKGRQIFEITTEGGYGLTFYQISDNNYDYLKVRQTYNGASAETTVVQSQVNNNMKHYVVTFKILIGVIEINSMVWDEQQGQYLAYGIVSPQLIDSSIASPTSGEAWIGKSQYVSTDNSLEMFFLKFTKKINEYMSDFALCWNNGTIGNGTNYDLSTNAESSTKISVIYLS